MIPESLNAGAVSGLRKAVLLVLTFTACLFLSWETHYRFNFFYPVWYEFLDIDGTIEYYGPRNAVRPGFHLTGRDERIRLFAAINRAVHGGTEQLAFLSYHDRRGRVLGSMLTAPERDHLAQVAALIRDARRWGAGITLAAAVLGVGLVLARYPPPRPVPAALGLAALLAALVVAVAALGAEGIFYRWHEWVFPRGQQWFFYYEESLMTLLMKAPHLFTGIAVTWITLAWGMFLAWLMLLVHIGDGRRP